MIKSPLLKKEKFAKTPWSHGPHPPHCQWPGNSKPQTWGWHAKLLLKKGNGLYMRSGENNTPQTKWPFSLTKGFDFIRSQNERNARSISFVTGLHGSTDSPPHLFRSYIEALTRVQASHKLAKYHRNIRIQNMPERSLMRLEERKAYWFPRPVDSDTHNLPSNMSDSERHFWNLALGSAIQPEGHNLTYLAYLCIFGVSLPNKPIQGWILLWIL